MRSFSLIENISIFILIEIREISPILRVVIKNTTTLLEFDPKIINQKV